MVKVTEWKRPFLKRYYPDRLFAFLPKKLGESEFERRWKPRILAEEKCEDFVWGRDLLPALAAITLTHSIPVYFLEDGFLRSIRPSASRTPPLSLVLDRRTPYFYCHEASVLEMLLKNYDFEADETLMSRAAAAIGLLLESGISKYNDEGHSKAEQIYGAKTRKRVLVIGQVEDDASIRYGCLSPLSNNDLVRLAASEQPEAQILSRPHRMS